MRRLVILTVGLLLTLGLLAPPPAVAHFNGNDSVIGDDPSMCVDVATGGFYEYKINQAMYRWQNAFDGAGVLIRHWPEQCSTKTLEVIKVDWGVQADPGSYYRKAWHTYGSIRLNQDRLQWFSESEKLHVIMHEFGHGLGLDHTWCDNIMAASGCWQTGITKNSHDRRDYCDLWSHGWDGDDEHAWEICMDLYQPV